MARAWAAPLVVAALLLAWLNQDHVGLRLVDFLFFCDRARRLDFAEAWLDPLYPVGYPLLLRLGTTLLGDALLAGRLIAGGAALLAVDAARRLLGPGAGWLALVAAPLLAFGLTEGTDLPAAALSLAALAAAVERRPVQAGLLLGGALLCRYTALAALPVVLAFSPARGRTLLALALATAPHWGMALFLGRSPLPDQSFNLAIAAGGPTALLSLETLRRWPVGLYGALWMALSNPLALAGGVALLGGALVGKRGARPLLALGLAHAGLIGLAFANARLVLPTALAAGLGLAALTPARLRLPLALGIGLFTIPAARLPNPEEETVAAVAPLLAEAPTPILTAHPWVWQRTAGGYLHAAIPLRELGGDPRQLDPATLVREAQRRGFATVVLEKSRVDRTYPGLRAMMRAKAAPEGLELVAKAGTWAVYRVRPGPAAAAP
jgi:hypothetical protein